MKGVVRGDRVGKGCSAKGREAEAEIRSEVG